MKTDELLKQGLKELNIPCSEDQLHAFMTLLSELKKWNRAYNLTALKTDKDIVIKHFIDSLLYLKALPENTLKLADAGAGAGFPGIPLKIVRPEIEMTLIEPTRKKATFLRQMIRLLNLRAINVMEKRIEDLGREHEGEYDVIVSRATFGITAFLKAACPYIKKTGILILSKGPKLSEELDELKKSAYTENIIQEIRQVHLPLTDTWRNMVILKCSAPITPNS